jgi:hypothetical protein
MFHAAGQTHDEANSRFSQLCEHIEECQENLRCCTSERCWSWVNLSDPQPSRENAVMLITSQCTSCTTLLYPIVLISFHWQKVLFTRWRATFHVGNEFIGTWPVASLFCIRCVNKFYFHASWWNLRTALQYHSPPLQISYLTGSYKRRLQDLENYRCCGFQSQCLKLTLSWPFVTCT